MFCNPHYFGALGIGLGYFTQNPDTRVFIQPSGNDFLVAPEDLTLIQDPKNFVTAQAAGAGFQMALNRVTNNPFEIPLLRKVSAVCELHNFVYESLYRQIVGVSAQILVLLDRYQHYPAVPRFDAVEPPTWKLEITMFDFLLPPKGDLRAQVARELRLLH
jgi:hypothetical protein